MPAPSPGTDLTVSGPDLLSQVSLIAPGTALRDGLDRIVNGHTGALVVLGENDELFQLSTGGFAIDSPLTPTALRELAKMDGAITLSSDLTRIRHASVHLMPRASLSTSETGTRHRTADRVAQQTGLPVVTVSASMATITLFSHGRRRVLERPENLMARANQAVAALARYRDRLSESVGRLNDLEVADQVTLRDLAVVAQRFELLRRLEAEVDAYVVELGGDGRLISLQVRDLMTGVEEFLGLLQRDYAGGQDDPGVGERLALASGDDLVDLPRLGHLLSPGHDLDSPQRPRGYRQLTAIPRLSPRVVDRLLDHFGSMYHLFGVGTSELLAVEGITLPVARIVRDGLLRLADSAYEK